MFLPIVRVWIGSIVGIYILKCKVFNIFRFALPQGVLLKIGSFWVEKMKVVGMVWECFGDVGASKSTNNNYINIKLYLKNVFLLKYRFLHYVTVFYIHIPLTPISPWAGSMVLHCAD